MIHIRFYFFFLLICLSHNPFAMLSLLYSITISFLSQTAAKLGSIAAEAFYSPEGNFVMRFNSAVQLEAGDIVTLNLPQAYYSDYASPVVVCFEENEKIKVGAQYFTYTNTPTLVQFRRILEKTYELDVNRVFTFHCTNIRLPTPVVDSTVYVRAIYSMHMHAYQHIICITPD